MFPIAARSAINTGRRYCPNLLSPTFSASYFTSSSFSPSFNVFSSFSRAFSSVGVQSASSLTWVSRISHGNNGVWGGGNSIGIGNVVGCNVGFGVGVGNGVGMRQSTETGMIVRRHLTTDGSKEPPEQRHPKIKERTSVSRDDGKVIQFTGKDLRGKKFALVEKVVADVRANECQSNLKANARSISHQQSSEQRRNAFISEKQECNPQIEPTAAKQRIVEVNASKQGVGSHRSSNSSSNTDSNTTISVGEIGIGRDSLRLKAILEVRKNEAVDDPLGPLKGDHLTTKKFGATSSHVINSNGSSGKDDMPIVSKNSSKNTKIGNESVGGSGDGSSRGDSNGVTQSQNDWLERWKSRHTIGQNRKGETRTRRDFEDGDGAYLKEQVSTNASTNDADGNSWNETNLLNKKGDEGLEVSDEDKRLALTIRLIIDHQALHESNSKDNGTPILTSAAPFLTSATPLTPLTVISTPNDDWTKTPRPILTPEEVESLTRGESNWQKLLHGDGGKAATATQLEDTDYVTRMAIQNRQEKKRACKSSLSSSSSATSSPSSSYSVRNWSWTPATKIKDEFCFGENMTSIVTKAAASESSASSSSSSSTPLKPSSSSSPSSPSSSSSSSSFFGDGGAASWFGKMGVSAALGLLGITLFSVPHEDIEEEEEKEDEEEYDTENNESIESKPKRLTRSISRNCNITASEILEDEEYGRVTSKGDAADATQTTLDHYRTEKYDGGGEGGVEEVEEGKEEREGKEDGICESGANFSSNSENASLGESGGNTVVEKDNFAQDAESDTEDSVTSVPPPVDQSEVVTKDQSNTIIFDALNQLIRIIL